MRRLFVPFPLSQSDRLQLSRESIESDDGGVLYSRGVFRPRAAGPERVERVSSYEGKEKNAARIVFLTHFCSAKRGLRTLLPHRKLPLGVCDRRTGLHGLDEEYLYVKMLL